MASFTVASLLGLTLLGLSIGDAPNVGASSGLGSVTKRRHFDIVGAAEEDDAGAGAPICLLQASAVLQHGGAAFEGGTEVPILLEGGTSDPIDIESLREEMGRALDGIEQGRPVEPEAEPKNESKPEVKSKKPTPTTPPPQELKSKVSEPEVKSTTSSLAFLGVLLLVLSFFYLINFHDEDIQRAAWSLLSYSISIFSAIMIFHVYSAAVALLWDQFDVAYAEEPSNPGRTAVILHFAQLLIIYAVLHGSLYVVRGWKSTLTAVGTLGAHVLGFSSIDAYGTLQGVPFFSETPGQSLYAVLIAAGFMLGGSLAHACARELLVGSKLERWKQQCCVSEREAAGLAIGYLLSQGVKFWVTGHFATSAITGPSQGEAWRLLLAAIGFAVLLVPMSAVLQGMIWAGASGWLRQIAQALQIIVAMSMGWCWLYWGKSLFWDAASAMTSGIFFLLVFTGGGVLMILLVNLSEGCGRSFAEKRCLQALVSALGLLLGFAFEACATEALAGLGAALPLSAAAEGPLVRFALPPVLLLLVLPAWALYVLPRAREKASESEPKPMAAFAAAAQLEASQAEPQPAAPFAAVVQAPRGTQSNGGFFARTGF